MLAQGQLDLGHRADALIGRSQPIDLAPEAHELQPATPDQAAAGSASFCPRTAGLLSDEPPQTWLEAAEHVLACVDQPVCKLVDEDPLQHVHHVHSSKHSAKHKSRKHEAASDSCAESVTSRSHSYSSGFDGSSLSSSGSGLNLSYAGSACSHEGCGNRPKSFTVGHLQAHKHRLASSTAPRSSSPPSSTHGGRCAHHHSTNCPTASTAPARSSCSKCGGQRQRPAASTATGLRREGSATQVGQYKPLTMSFSGGAYCAGDVRLMSSSPGGLPQRGLLMAESVNLEDIGKGFKAHWYYSNRVLQVYDGSMPADPRLLLKHVPQQPGLHLWLIKPPCSRQWVPVRLDAADNLQQALSECLHADGSCGPPGSKQRVLLDLQSRGFAVQVRYRPVKPSCSSVQQDLLSKLQCFDFALDDVDNNGCRPIELPDGRPVYSYPLVVGHMMKLFEQRFVQPKLL